MLGLFWVPKIIKVRTMKILAVFFKALASVLAMGAFVLVLKAKLNMIIVIALGGIIYFTVLFALGGFKKEDILSILSSFRTRNS